MAYLWTAFFSLLPVSELRGGIPFALVNGIPWFAAWPFASAVNALAAPLCWIFLSTLHRLFYGRPGAPEAGAGPRSGFTWYRAFFDRFVNRARKKLEKGVERWGILGVALFVAIPLPLTGAWTGTLGAWVLGLPKRKTLPAVILGVAVAGGIVTAVTLLGRGAFSVFIKKP
ncbi:MAG: small multi-drug export protein [Treponema sp.]|nr:small multi-drug export protein [Treponema sp.]